MSMALVFATWFGAETVLGVSATFLNNGLGRHRRRPVRLLVLPGVHRAVFRARLLPPEPAHHRRFLPQALQQDGRGRHQRLRSRFRTSAGSSAQLTALGLVFHMLSGGAISLGCRDPARRRGRPRVHALRRHVVGGATTIVVPVGGHPRRPDLPRLAARRHGGRPRAQVIAHAAEAGKFEFWPKVEAPRRSLAFLAAFMTAAIGSIPQQDVFQRVTSAKDANTAVRGTLIGAVDLFLLRLRADLPRLLRAADRPEDGRAAAQGRERRDPAHPADLIASHDAAVSAQVLFFGALLSAIMSSALRPRCSRRASLFTENVVRPFVPRMSDRQLLLSCAWC